VLHPPQELVESIDAINWNPQIVFDPLAIESLKADQTIVDPSPPCGFARVGVLGYVESADTQERVYRCL
jgi:hypothetical protein